uniref:ORF-36 n=1 Tax=Buzura suppressaria nuclear polyhedrosis virus TaxID=74320 RepID=A0A0N7CU86_NPVBS|nr:ORF-36 [Buzura suppressaria nucleopolyhedrovirus]
MSPPPTFTRLCDEMYVFRLLIARCEIVSMSLPLVCLYMRVLLIKFSLPFAPHAITSVNVPAKLSSSSSPHTISSSAIKSHNFLNNRKLKLELNKRALSRKSISSRSAKTIRSSYVCHNWRSSGIVANKRSNSARFLCK